MTAIDTGPGVKKKTPASFGERGAGEFLQAPSTYRKPCEAQAESEPAPGGQPTPLNDLREAARAIKGLTLPDWMGERILAGLVKEHSAAIACELLTGDEGRLL